MTEKTLQDLVEFVETRALDSDEYFMVNREYRDNLNEPLFAKDTRWIAVYFVIGGNEGWYLHVDRVCNDTGSESWRTDHLATGKYWSAYQAMIAVALLTEWIYSDMPYARYIVMKTADNAEETTL